MRVGRVTQLCCRQTQKKLQEKPPLSSWVKRGISELGSVCVLGLGGSSQFLFLPSALKPAHVTELYLRGRTLKSLRENLSICPKELKKRSQGTMKSMGRILTMYFSFSVTTSTQEGPKGVRPCNSRERRGTKTQRRKSQLSSEKARKTLLVPENIRKVPKSTGTEISWFL